MTNLARISHQLLLRSRPLAPRGVVAVLANPSGPLRAHRSQLLARHGLDQPRCESVENAAPTHFGRVLALLAVAVLALGSTSRAAPQALAPAPARAPEEQQIHWQRSLEDAVALAAAEKRPILVAINVDGESGSDRIVREQYRDPKFVAATRSFVCLVASVSRHNLRDFDERGRRIPCPRLGEVTCGEHAALEPIVFDRYLGGERISPRHALILPDGTKSFDVSLLFDITELDELVLAASRAAPPPLPGALVAAIPDKSSERAKLIRTAASARSARGRERFEGFVAGQRSEAGVLAFLDVVEDVGDAGSIGALRICLSSPTLTTPRVIGRVADVAAALEIGPALARVVRDRLTTCNPYPGAVGLGADRALLSILARFDGANPATRSYLLARCAVGQDADRRAAADAVAALLSADDVSRVAAAIEAEGGGVQIEELLVFARDVGRALPRDREPAPSSAAAAPEVLPSAEELDRRLAETDRVLSAQPDDVDAQVAFGLTSLDVARRAIESGGANPTLHLIDAETWLGRAARARPTDARLGFARARTAYLLGKFDEQESIARGTFGGFPPRDAVSPRLAGVIDAARLPDGDVRRAATLIDDAERLEALRWLGDAAARRLPSRAGRDPVEEVVGHVRGARALALVAVAPGSGEIDWISWATFLSALELEREELAVWQAGAERLPDSNALRQGLNRSLWLAGRMDLAPVKADWLLARRREAAVEALASSSAAPSGVRAADSPADNWYAGYAWLLWAEEMRRAHAFDAALAAYATSRARFENYARLAPDRAADVAVYLGMTHLGEGHAHAAEGRRQSAADALVRGVTASKGVLTARDGLDRDVPDLIDAIAEWRAGRKSPVDPRALAEPLRRAAPGESGLLIAVSDAQLREALRADGRSRRTRTTHDGSIERVPAEEGDEYMLAAIDVARFAVELDTGTDGAPARRNLAQALTVHAERQLARDDTSAFARLVEAASILEQPPPVTDDLPALRATAARLRAILGEARPIFREGR